MDRARTGVRSTLDSADPGQGFKSQSAVEFVPWAAENLFVPSFPYSPDAQLDDALRVKSEYPPFGGGQQDWPDFTALSRPPVSAPLLNTIPFFSGDASVSPTGWTLETDSDSCDFSPIDICRPMTEVDATASTNPGWSWSQPSSPSAEVESLLPSPPATRAEHKTGAVPVPAPAPRAANKAKAAPKLRTTSRTARKPSRRSSRNSAASPPEQESNNTNATDEHAAAEDQELRARRNHNLVEKQYRNRLNAQFERLFSVLPTDQQRRSGRSGDEDGSAGSDDNFFKRMSKAEVLDCATRRIKELESERYRLQREREELMRSMDLMNEAIPRVSAR